MDNEAEKANNGGITVTDKEKKAVISNMINDMTAQDSCISKDTLLKQIANILTRTSDGNSKLWIDEIPENAEVVKELVGESAEDFLLERILDGLQEEAEGLHTTKVLILEVLVKKSIGVARLHVGCPDDTKPRVVLKSLKAKYQDEGLREVVWTLKDAPVAQIEAFRNHAKLDNSLKQFLKDVLVHLETPPLILTRDDLRYLFGKAKLESLEMMGETEEFKRAEKALRMGPKGAIAKQLWELFKQSAKVTTASSAPSSNPPPKPKDPFLVQLDLSEHELPGWHGKLKALGEKTEKEIIFDGMSNGIPNGMSNGMSLGDDETKDLLQLLDGMPRKFLAKYPFDGETNVESTKQLFVKEDSSRVGLEFKADDFKVVRRVGSGSFADVYLVEHVDLEGPICIKVIAKNQLICRDKRRLMVNELNIHSKLDHDNVLKMLGWFQDKDFIYILMEYALFGSLAGVVWPRTHDAWELRCIRYIQQAAEGLKYLCGENVIHRDIKDANLLLDHNHNLRIADFGISAMSNARRQTQCGTRFFMAPEVRKGEPHSVEVDVFSLGVLWCDLLYGEDFVDYWYTYEHDDGERELQLKISCANRRVHSEALIVQMMEFNASERIPIDKLICELKTFQEELSKSSD